ncbi:LysE family translocator [Vallitalea okinawensis]|uniref:LysE family translocator n=1 Tax=Vallitalea okinawensis TaxID=2078660 RepID=UPI000CFDCC0A|nr:LysE family translocator [Vallitalea okinawensis]
MEISNIIGFLFAAVLLTITPGPDLIFVLTQSMSNGRKAGIATALGLCTGLILHTTAAALGISAILRTSALAFNIIKYAGAIYLLYLAYKALREGEHSLEVDSATVKLSSIALYKRGIFMNILNPKVALFFLALLPQFVTAEAGNTTMQMLLLGLIFMIQAICVFSLVAVLAGYFGEKLSKSKKFAWIMNKAKALIFAIIGLKIALLD